MAFKDALRCNSGVKRTTNLPLNFRVVVPGGWRQGFTARQEVLDPFFDDPLQLREHRGFSVTVAGLTNQWWRAADEALVLGAPLNDFEIVLCGFFDLSFGWFHLRDASMALRTNFS
jgi:hypothetical protein